MLYPPGLAIHGDGGQTIHEYSQLALSSYPPASFNLATMRCGIATVLTAFTAFAAPVFAQSLTCTIPLSSLGFNFTPAQICAALPATIPPPGTTVNLIVATITVEAGTTPPTTCTGGRANTGCALTCPGRPTIAACVSVP